MFPENGAVSTSPLPEEQRTRLLGTYSFDVSPNQRIDVTLEGNEAIKTLTWTRRGKLGRPIYHLESNMFHSAGRRIRLDYAVLAIDLSVRQLRHLHC